MVRKVPCKKHKKIKDPIQQNLVRFDRIKNNINNPPLNVNDQEIPNSLRELMRLKEIGKGNKVKNTFSQGNKNKSSVKYKSRKNNSTPRKKFPSMKRFQDEDDDLYEKRVGNMCDEIINESNMERQYNVIVERNHESGIIENVAKKPSYKTTAKPKKPPKESSQQRKRILKQEKEKMKLQENMQFKDNVQFGEVVHAPPSLNLPRKAEKNALIFKPGSKNLLLKNIMYPADVNAAKSKTKTLKSKNSDSNISKKVYLSKVAKERREQDRQAVVAAYRNIKNKKSNISKLV